MRGIGIAIRVYLVLLILFSAFAFLTGSVANLAVNGSLMLEKMERFSDTSAAGVDKAEYPKLAGAITDYRKGLIYSAQVQVKAAQGERAAFSDDELLHLKDIRELINLSHLLRRIAGILMGKTLIGFLLLRHFKKEITRFVRADLVFRFAAWLFGLPVLVIGAWALINFEGLFIQFHRLLFTNELWLLDPSKDLLLQLMPQRFFTSYLWDFLKYNLFLLLALPLAAFGLNTSQKDAKP